MSCDFRQAVGALSGFIIFLMTTIVSLAAPILFGSPLFPSVEKSPSSDFGLKKANAYFHRILEIIPDTNKDFLLSVIRDVLTKHADASLEHVVNVILEKTEVKKDVQIARLEDEHYYVECGCCFSTFPFEEMVQCPETHLFCSPCMNQHASNLLGSHNPEIRCIDQSGCTSPISASELQRLLSPKMMDLWERARSRRALDSARLENLYYCPFCDWACIIEGRLTGILICRNKSVCGRSSCIRCGKMDHRPSMCDDQLEGKHHVDEAMSGALVRHCPGCKKSFIKESGCNRIRCPYPECGTESCYNCRETVTGYDHFDRSITGKPGQLRKGHGKCPLWDRGVEERHNEEVRIAAEQALQKYEQKSRTKGFKRWWWRK